MKHEIEDVFENPYSSETEQDELLRYEPKSAKKEEENTAKQDNGIDPKNTYRIYDYKISSLNQNINTDSMADLKLRTEYTETKATTIEESMQDFASNSLPARLNIRSSESDSEEPGKGNSSALNMVENNQSTNYKISKTNKTSHALIQSLYLITNCCTKKNYLL